MTFDELRAAVGEIPPFVKYGGPVIDKPLSEVRAGDCLIDDLHRAHPIVHVTRGNYSTQLNTWDAVFVFLVPIQEHVYAGRGKGKNVGFRKLHCRADETLLVAKNAPKIPGMEKLLEGA